jgi:hypothetical protein
MDLLEAITHLEAWQRQHDSRSIETINNPVLGGVTARALTLEGMEQYPAGARRIVKEWRANTLHHALLRLAGSLSL